VLDGSIRGRSTSSKKIDMRKILIFRGRSGLTDWRLCGGSRAAIFPHLRQANERALPSTLRISTTRTGYRKQHDVSKHRAYRICGKIESGQLQNGKRESDLGKRERRLTLKDEYLEYCLVPLRRCAGNIVGGRRGKPQILGRE
jgi:hypothetical protein